MADRVLQLLQEQLAGKEMALVLAPQEEKVRIQQQIAALKGEIAAREGELAGRSPGEEPPQPAPTGTEQVNQGQSTGYQVNQPQGPVVQGEGNSVVVNYYGAGGANSPQTQPPGQGQGPAGENRSTSRVQQLRRDRLQREFQQLEEEYQAVSDQVAATIDPTVQMRLGRQLEQLEQKMAAIEAALKSH